MVFEHIPDASILYFFINKPSHSHPFTEVCVCDDAACIEWLTLSASHPRLHSANPYPPPGRNTPYRLLGLIDHVPRSTLEQGCVFGNGFVASCHVVVWNRLSPNSRRQKGYAYLTTYSCAPLNSERLMPFGFSLHSASRTATRSLYAMILSLDTPGRGSSVRLNECAIQVFTNPLYTSFFSFEGLLCASKAMHEEGRMKK